MPLYKEVTYIGPPNSYLNTSFPKYGITIHSTENDASARDEASYARIRKDSVSSHYYVDNNGIIQSLNTNYGAYHVGSTYGNRHLISYEMCGKASWSRSKWIDNIDLDKAAQQIARDCVTWNIPGRILSVAMLRNHERGICTHNDCRLALGGTDHTDPGSNFPMVLLVDKVASILNGTDMDPKDFWQLDIIPNPAARNEPDNPTTKADFAIGHMWDLIFQLHSKVDALTKLVTDMASGGATAEEVKKLIGTDLLDDNT